MGKATASAERLELQRTTRHFVFGVSGTASAVQWSKEKLGRTDRDNSSGRKQTMAAEQDTDRVRKVFTIGARNRCSMVW